MTVTCGMQNVGGLVLPSSEATELKESLTYNVVYENLLYCLFVFLGPLLVLIVLNARLIQVYIISNQLINPFSRHQSSDRAVGQTLHCRQPSLSDCRFRHLEYIPEKRRQ